MTISTRSNRRPTVNADCCLATHLWNAAANYATTDALTMFIAVKNLFDRTVIVDRARGILPSAPRMVHAGVKFTF